MQQTIKATKLADRALSGFKAAQTQIEKACGLHAEAKTQHLESKKGAERLARTHEQGAANADAEIERLQRVRAKLAELVA